ncbi:MFS transporter, DHA2 family, multidrug resistance protein [Salinibacterium xinjiangense]|uniref:MFS transporter, DHA2 family, multidrug resistance protein n=1 Tax=Salinibacterium xinjiangense TaxID=386302 RepID=A0A2C8YSQ9_9MICO|nr:MFS transporter [Salinibacterium xinjiangense]SOE53687.1 MFS transporter, DHA2 family, multidrug resistance protein [Salinibacterium xinjiangense]
MIVDEVTVKAGPRQWAGLAVLMLPVLLISIDNTVLSFALPEISRNLRPSAAGQLWIVDAYPLVLAGLLVAMGNLGDRFGRRRMLMIGTVGFGAVSALAAFAPSADLLIAARVLLGFFGAMLMPSTLSLLRNLFTDRRQRRLAIAIWAAGFSAGSAIGPVVGGVLLEHFWWGSVFLIAVPVLLPLLVLVPLLVPESSDPSPGPFDLVSILLSMAALTPIVYAIKSVATDGIGVLPIALVAIGLLSGVFFVRRLLAQPNPMLDMRLFRVPTFSGAVIVNLVSVFSLVGFLYFLTQHLQLVIGLSPLNAALVLIPGVVIIIVTGLLAVPLVRIVRPGFVMAAGLGLCFTAYAMTAIIGSSSTVTTLIVAFCLLGAGIGAAETLANDMVIASVPPEKAGAASGVSETAYELGAVLGTAVLGSILAAFYRSSIVIPNGVSAVDAQAARDTLGGAVEVSSALPGGVGEALLESARSAFDSGVTVTSWFAAAMMIVAITVTLLTLRKARG